jgi:ABC-type Fe3+-hydroxamate transport system substrate-binding protein
MIMAVDQMGRSVRLPGLPQRIISLVPSQTELLHDLGLGDRVVGITKFCVHPEEWFRTKPRVGGTKQVDLAKVRALQPDLVIGNKEENAQADIEALAREFPVWMSDVENLDGALAMIRMIGGITRTADAATRITASIRLAFGGLRPLPRPVKAAYFIWRKPWMLAGAPTFIRDMLLRCGFTPCPPTDLGRYPECSDDQLRTWRPELVLLSSEPYPFGEKHVPEVRKIMPDARIMLVDGELFSWYGSRLLYAPRYFQELLDRVMGGR